MRKPFISISDTPKIFCLFILLLSFLFSPVAAEVIDSSYVGDIHLVEGELEQIKVYALTRLSITDPDIADIIDADDDEILIVASQPGETVLFIWDEKGKRSINIYVSGRDLIQVRDRLKELFRSVSLHEAIVKINEGEGKVVIGGEIPEHKEELFEQIIEPFDEEIISLAIAEENENMVQIDMQITELSETLSKSLGIEWSAGGDSEDSEGGTATTGGGTATTATTSNDSGSGITLPYEESLPEFDGSISDFFKIGDFERTEALTATVNALITEGKARVLSQPRLVVKNGEEASFLVGGEIPIRTTSTSSSGTSQENVEFKEYGIGMTLTPTLRKEKIEIILNVEISDIDASASGDDVAFVTRSANTTLLLDDMQTIVLAGLIRQSESERVRKTPFLGDLPIVGLLFRSRSTPAANQDSEVVISLTPHIVHTGVKSVFIEEEEEPTPFAMERPALRRQPPNRVLSLPTEMREYIQTVQDQISKAVVYPQEAQRYGWEGTVRVGLHILNDGTLAYALVKESSGFEIIDDFALKTTQDVAPFGNFPPDTNLQEVNVTIPIVYSLKR